MCGVCYHFSIKRDTLSKSATHDSESVEGGSEGDFVSTADDEADVGSDMKPRAESAELHQEKLTAPPPTPALPSS